ncbi:DUF6745 domain-containing protein [Actinomadura sp. DC4]|uniref:DUF6745 domain-containing protein n=1 Tax=Actinomadura sp. DC4 TaxID=3055069 RepID=UPI0025B06419|nr:hypothetical protein [Actinomadura sp. DC4]MDN3358799.1 hypothetical protein [Actinomadura sp. DC4]
MSVATQLEAAEIREEWLGSALSTRPADRPAAEAAISGLYHLIGLAPPRFHWVSSPVTALQTVPPGVPLRSSESVSRLAEWPLPRRFAALLTALWTELETRFRCFDRQLSVVLQREVSGPLWQSCRSSLYPSLRAADDSVSHRGNGWYDLQCVSRIAHYDAVRRLTGASFGPSRTRLFDLWAAQARTCGWWWPREHVCVVSERPVELHTEVWSATGAVRLHRADGPALRYTDGWDLHSWHGTQVPAWAIEEPRAWRIAQEPNVEVRRCAIENLGWGTYIEEAGLTPVASVPDPGNPGAELLLYAFREGTKVLLAVNGSVERDGQRRRYGLTVPGFLTDPLAAAGWTYGLSAEQYSRLVRRT